MAELGNKKALETVLGLWLIFFTCIVESEPISIKPHRQHINSNTHTEHHLLSMADRQNYRVAGEHNVAEPLIKQRPSYFFSGIHETKNRGKRRVNFELIFTRCVCWM